MHSPPTSRLFFSSPPIYTGSGPEEEVEVLLATAQKVKALNQNLSILDGKNQEAFLNLFGRQVQLVKSRSQAFEDAHVTVYDKVLLKLTENGNKLESPAAITWYCTEYLGINPSGGIDQNTHLIEQALKVPATLSQALTPSPSRKNSDGVVAMAPGNLVNPLEKLSCREDPNFARLWAVYRKAHTDYLALADKHNDRALEAAKFLRDTAENGIHYLRKRHPKDPALAELIDTCDMTKKAVLSLNGGKKRKFDHTIGRDERNSEVAYSPHAKLHKPVGGGRRLLLKSAHGKEKKRGRGPSGIPYGYTRPVDSYYPAEEEALMSWRIHPLDSY